MPATAINRPSQKTQHQKNNLRIVSSCKHIDVISELIICEPVIRRVVEVESWCDHALVCDRLAVHINILDLVDVVPRLTDTLVIFIDLWHISVAVVSI